MVSNIVSAPHKQTLTKEIVLKIIELYHKLFHIQIYNVFPWYRNTNEIKGQKIRIRSDRLNYSAK